jgi:hypothetical protein
LTDAERYIVVMLSREVRTDAWMSVDDSNTPDVLDQSQKKRAVVYYAVRSFQLEKASGSLILHCVGKDTNHSGEGTVVVSDGKAQVGAVECGGLGVGS